MSAIKVWLLTAAENRLYYARRLATCPRAAEILKTESLVLSVYGDDIIYNTLCALSKWYTHNKRKRRD